MRITMVENGAKRLAALALTAGFWVASSPLPAAAQPRFDECRPAEVMVFTMRLHVRCETPVQGFAYFAVPTANAGLAGQMLSLLSTAMVTGRSLTVLYNPADQSGGAVGCLVHDCRLLQAAGFWK